MSSVISVIQPETTPYADALGRLFPPNYLADEPDSDKRLWHAAQCLIAALEANRFDPRVMRAYGFRPDGLPEATVMLRRLSDHLAQGSTWMFHPQPALQEPKFVSPDYVRSNGYLIDPVIVNELNPSSDRLANLPDVPTKQRGAVSWGHPWRIVAVVRISEQGRTKMEGTVAFGASDDCGRAYLRSIPLCPRHRIELYEISAISLAAAEEAAEVRI